MKFFFLLLTISLQVNATCFIDWKKDKLELVELKSGCQLNEEKKVDCYILKTSLEKGATLFRKGISSTSFCLEGHEMEIFESSLKDGPKAYIECEGISKPKGIRLESPDKKLFKNCEFPYK